MVDPRPSVTIVITTLDRAPYLRRLLASLAHVAYERFEIVVVNGPSRDDTDAVLAELGSRIKVARCPRANLNESRNVGITVAAGDLVAFIDDDALPASPDWLDHLIAPFMDAPRVAASGGPVLEGDGTRVEFSGGATSDYGLQVFSGDPPEDGERTRWIRGVRGTNCVFRRDVVWRLGGFDEMLPYYLDETDLCWRIVLAGYEIAMVPAASVRHYSAPGARRRAWHDLDWRTIARSDTYYALKNGADPLPRRLMTTLRLAPRKHFVREVSGYRRDAYIGTVRLLRYRARWARGVVAGLWRGLARARRTPLGRTASTPPPFLPFGPVRPARRLAIGLVAREYDRRRGDVARYTRELAHGLHALGHEVHVFTEAAERLRREGLRVIVHGLASDDEWASALANRVGELAREGITLDVIEMPSSDAEAALPWRGTRLPVIVRVGSPLGVTAETMRTADGVIAGTDGTLEMVRDALAPGATPRTVRIPFGVAAPLAEADRPDRPRIVFVGDDAARAVLPTLRRRHRDLHVDVIGDDGPNRAHDEQLYRACTLVVVASREEPSGLAHLEAMRYGKPVIGCRGGDVPAVVRDGETGLLVPPDDPGALAAAIERVLDNPGLAERLGTGARTAVATEFSTRLMAERTAAFYDDVIARTDASREHVAAARGF